MLGGVLRGRGPFSAAFLPPPTIRAFAFGEGSWWATDVPAKSLFPINFLPSDLTLAPDFVVDCPLYRRDTCRFDCA